MTATRTTLHRSYHAIFDVKDTLEVGSAEFQKAADSLRALADLMRMLGIDTPNRFDADRNAAPPAEEDLNDIRERIWQLSDGYGEPGYVPVQGHDWSGIRDSSPEAVAAMHAVAAEALG